MEYHPGLYLAWYRFHSFLTADYQRIQIKAIRQYADSRQWITHNFHPYDELGDRAVIGEDLDLSVGMLILPERVYVSILPKMVMTVTAYGESRVKTFGSWKPCRASLIGVMLIAIAILEKPEPWPGI